MRRSKRPIVIASRQSPLAKAQAQLIGQALGRLHPRLSVQYHWLEAEGDRHQAIMAGQAGAKGGFTATIEQAVLHKQADLAVHSLKDLPGQETPGLTLAAMPRRGPVADCLISRGGATDLAELPAKAILATASPRRAAQVRHRRPDIAIRPIRGNVQTRLSKVLEATGPERFDATLLAAAGLHRAGLGEHANHPLPTDQLLPAASQGALAIQCRADDHVTLTRCLPLNDAETAAAVHAERQIVAALDADCHSPLAVLAQPMTAPADARRSDGQWFDLRAKVIRPDGQRVADAHEQAPTKRLRHHVQAAIDTLKERGAATILAEARQASGEGA